MSERASQARSAEERGPRESAKRFRGMHARKRCEVVQ